MNEDDIKLYKCVRTGTIILRVGEESRVLTAGELSKLLAFPTQFDSTQVMGWPA